MITDQCTWLIPIQYANLVCIWWVHLAHIRCWFICFWCYLRFTLSPWALSSDDVIIASHWISQYFCIAFSQCLLLTHSILACATERATHLTIGTDTYWKFHYTNRLPTECLFMLVCSCNCKSQNYVKQFTLFFCWWFCHGFVCFSVASSCMQTFWLFSIAFDFMLQISFLDDYRIKHLF